MPPPCAGRSCPSPRRRRISAAPATGTSIMPLYAVSSMGVPNSGAFGTGAVVAADIDDERVVELALVLDLLDHAANFMVGVGGVGGEDLRLAGEELLLVGDSESHFGSFAPPCCPSGHGVSCVFAG